MIKRVEKKIIVKNKQGLHARPAALFVQIANKYDATVKVVKDEQIVNGTSIMGILMLAAEKEQRALSSGEGRISAGGVERDITFEEPEAAVDADLHAAYHAKYDRYGPSMVGTVVSPEAARSTLRLVPR